MEWGASVAGALVVAFVLRDIFHTLLHPTADGSMSRTILRVVWRAFHWQRGRKPLTLAGPVGFVAVVATWTLLLVLGFACVYWRHLDDSFTFVSNLEPGANVGFTDSVYFSAVTLATLGYGDVAAATTPWRIVAVFEATIGLALLTAAVSWLLSIYAALQRRRALGGLVSAICESELPSPQLIESVAAAVQSVRADLSQHSATYYFHARDASLVLAAGLPALEHLASHSQRQGGRTLDASLRGFGETLRTGFLTDARGPREAVAAYAADHRVTDRAEELRSQLARVMVAAQCESSQGGTRRERSSA